MKRVLVTGASGFFGSHICEVAHQAGYEVHALIRKTSSREWLRRPWIKIHDTGLNKGSELSALLDNMDVVIHNAGATSGFGKQAVFEINVEATRMIAEASIKARVKRFVYISSQAAGGPSAGPVPKTEDDPDTQITDYGASKKAAEEALLELKDKLRIVILRYPAIYGPRNREMLQAFQVLKGVIHPIIGTKPVYISMIYVTDAARAAVAGAEAKVKSGSIYYITDGVDYTLEYANDLIAGAMGKNGIRVKFPFWIVKLVAWWRYDIRKIKSSFTPKKVDEFKMRFWLISPRKAIVELGWKPEVMLQQGIAETVKWYRARRWL